MTSHDSACSRPKVSVIMAVRNGGTYLTEALDSVLSQTLSDWEFIVVNDGSTDQTAARLEEYARRDSRVRVVHQAHASPARARMHALTLCSGEYIGNLDADDVMLPERLERQVRYMDDHPDVGLLGSAAELIDCDGKVYCTYIWPSDDNQLRQLLKRDNPFFHSAVMLRASALGQTAAYDEAFTIAEDYDLWLRLAQHCHLASLPIPLIRYRTHAQSLTRTRRRRAAREVMAIQWRAIRSGWHEPLALVFVLRPLFYLVAPQPLADFIYWHRERSNRGVVIRTASWWPALRRTHPTLSVRSA